MRLGPRASVDTRTPCAPHARDPVDVPWEMRAWLVALAPCLLLGAYGAGARAHPADGWLACARGGAVEVAPLLAVACAVEAAWTRLFALARRRRVVPGLCLTALLFAACAPPALSLGKVALALSFGVVFGRELFGGTARNVFHPAVVGLAFATLAWPADVRGPALAAEDGTTWMAAFLGGAPGGVGETSKLACLVGGLVLVHQRVASWRTMVAVLVGAAATGAVLPGPAPHWHLVLGGLAFGAVFLATDPVTSPTTDAGRWVHGLLVGAVTVVVRVLNPVQVEGILFAVLFGNACAPLCDAAVVRLHILARRRRLART